MSDEDPGEWACHYEEYDDGGAAIIFSVDLTEEQKRTDIRDLLRYLLAVGAYVYENDLLGEPYEDD